MDISIIRYGVTESQASFFNTFTNIIYLVSFQFSE